MGERRNLICIELRFSGKNAYVEANVRKSTHRLIFEKMDLNLPQGYSRLMTILAGTSGWSYDDWVGPFYPHTIWQIRKENGSPIMPSISKLSRSIAPSSDLQESSKLILG